MSARTNGRLKRFSFHSAAFDFAYCGTELAFETVPNGLFKIPFW
jgi:hypothetical protein